MTWLTRRVVLGVLAALAVLLAALSIYVVVLDRQIVRQFEGRRWNLPAQVYARPLEVFAGSHLRPADLELELSSLGYTQVRSPGSQGTFRREGNRITLVTRPFQFWDGHQDSRQATVAFGPDGVATLTDAAGAALPLLRLDPPFIGNIFAVHGEDRVVLAPADVPPLLLQGLKVVEDRDFDTHVGVSPKAIARAMWANLRAGGFEQGGSTLTQQLVRSYFLSNERTLGRKLREALMSILLELHFGKDDLLNAYVNEIYLGQAGDRAIHGFGLASQFYFGKPLTELDLHETALLIAVVRGPSYYDPRRHPDRARKRRDLVLDLMAEQGVIPAAAAAKAKSKPLGVRGTATTFASYNPTFMDLVRRELRASYKEEDLLNEGLRIMTTLDPRIQALAEAQLADGLGAVERARKLAPGTLDGAVVVTGIQTPDVVAIVGGRNSRMQGFNRALDAARPIGSLAKPVVYLTALESGRYTLASPLEDAPLDLRLPNGQRWRPENYDRNYRGEVPVVRALADSLNTPTVRLGMDVGAKQVAETFRSLGLDAAPKPLPSMFLGAVALSPLEVAQTYNSLANGGFRSPLTAVRAVLGADGRPLDRYKLSIDRAADPAAVYALNAALVQVIERGTGRPARRWLPPGLIAAGKTGTSDDLRDSWFAGFTNDHLAVVWVGADNNDPTGLTGATGALPIWARIVADLGDTGYEPVPAAGLEDVWIDFDTGLLAEPGCGDPVRLPVPSGTSIAGKPGCGGLEDIGRKGTEWFKRLFN